MRALQAVALLSIVVIPAWGQVHAERDRTGQIVITNRGSSAAAKLPAPDSAQMLPRLSPGQRQSIQKRLKAACSQKGLDYNLVTALVEAESGFQPNIISKKGAVGLMQLLPETGKRFGCSDPWDMEENISGGTNFLAYLQDLFAGDIPLMLAAYNAGENAVAKYGNRIPPYAETVRYVFAILEDYGNRELIGEAKRLLATPADYDKYYVPFKNSAPVLRMLYMWDDGKGVRSYSDYPPSGVQSIPIVFKDE